MGEHQEVVGGRGGEFMVGVAEDINLLIVIRLEKKLEEVETSGQLQDIDKVWDWVCLKVTEENLAVMPQVLSIERLKSMDKQQTRRQN